jgi:predicted ArsR family transcriptional regulator
MRCSSPRHRALGRSSRGAEEYEVGETRREILAYLRENGPATPKTIAETLSIEHDAARS